jgi:hypothetical protein
MIWPATLTKEQLAHVVSRATDHTMPPRTVRKWCEYGALVPVMTEGRANLFTRDDALVALLILRLQKLVGFQSPLPMRVAREARPKLQGALPMTGGRPTSHMEVVAWENDTPILIVIPKEELSRMAEALDELAG